MHMFGHGMRQVAVSYEHDNNNNNNNNNNNTSFIKRRGFHQLLTKYQFYNQASVPVSYSSALYIYIYIYIYDIVIFTMYN